MHISRESLAFFRLFNDTDAEVTPSPFSAAGVFFFFETARKYEGT